MNGVSSDKKIRIEKTMVEGVPKLSFLQNTNLTRLSDINDLTNAIREICDSGAKYIIIDLRCVFEVISPAFAPILDAHKRLVQSKGTVVVLSVKQSRLDQIWDIISASKFKKSDDPYKIYKFATTTEAVDYLKKYQPKRPQAC